MTQMEHTKNVLTYVQSLKTIENYWIYKGAWGVWNNENKNSLRRIHLTEHIFNLKKMSIQAHQSQDPPVEQVMIHSFYNVL